MIPKEQSICEVWCPSSSISSGSRPRPPEADCGVHTLRGGVKWQPLCLAASPNLSSTRAYSTPSYLTESPTPKLTLLKITHFACYRMCVIQLRGAQKKPKPISSPNLSSSHLAASSAFLPQSLPTLASTDLLTGLPLYLVPQKRMTCLCCGTSP